MRPESVHRKSCEQRGFFFPLCDLVGSAELKEESRDSRWEGGVGGVRWWWRTERDVADVARPDDGIKR